MGAARVAAETGEHPPTSPVGAWAVRAVVASVQALVSPRGLGVIVLGLAAVLCCWGWIRPPLSPDITAAQLPLGSLLGDAGTYAELLHGPRQWRWDSLGVALLILLGVGGVLLLWRPSYFSVFAGVLLTVVVAANAAIAGNHPLLTASLVAENVQRDRMVAVLWSLQEDSVSNRGNGRVPFDGKDPSDPDDWNGGCYYLFCGAWLAALAMGASLFASRGGLLRRLSVLTVWTAVAIGTAGIVCLPRLVGEYWWYRATVAELQTDFPSARQAMERAITTFPELGLLRRAKLLKGKLDFSQDRNTPELQFWISWQLSYRRELLLRQDELAAGDTRVRARKKLPLVNSSMEELLRQTPHDPTLTQETADILTITGLQFLNSQNFGAAGDAFRRAASAQPGRMDSAFYRGVILSQWDRLYPERAEAAMTPLLQRCADIGIRADILTLLGNAYFDAGDLSAARDRYAQSYDLYNLPMRNNLPAQKRLGGM